MNRMIPTRNHNIEYVVFNPISTDFKPHLTSQQHQMNQPSNKEGSSSKILLTVVIIVGIILIGTYLNSNQISKNKNEQNE